MEESGIMPGSFYVHAAGPVLRLKYCMKKSE